MPGEYLKKQPTKNEQMIYDLYRHFQSMDRVLGSTASFSSALGYILKVDPEEMAKLLTTDYEKIREYTEKVNKAISEIEKKRAPQGEHDHGHEGHDHEGHDHE